jgi:hypothetical protein
MVCLIFIIKNSPPIMVLFLSFRDNIGFLSRKVRTIKATILSEGDVSIDRS